MTATVVVADAGPLIALAVGEVLSQSIAMLGKVLVPQAVLDECLAEPNAAGATTIRELVRSQAFGLIANSEIASLDDAFARGLGSGEAAVLAYASLHGHIALIDERRARQVAMRMKLPIIGTGTIVLALKAQKHIASVMPVLQLWKAHGYHLSASIAAEIIERAGEA